MSRPKAANRTAAPPAAAPPAQEEAGKNEPVKLPARAGQQVVDGTCPHCNHLFELPPAGAQGQMVTCPDCRSEFTRGRYLAPANKHVERVGEAAPCGRCGTVFKPRFKNGGGISHTGCPTCGLPQPGQPTFSTLEQQNAPAV